MYCAANAGRLSQVAEIARSTATTRPHVHKMLHPLVEAQLLTTVRGRNGGLRLARPADEITVLDVVRVTEEDFIMAECFDNELADCPLIDNCALNSALREALTAFFSVLARYTIADLIAARADIGVVFRLPGTDRIAG